MPHVFVESNWLFSFAAPAHHQVPAATDLLQRAKDGEFTLHLPSVCIGEARQAILSKCQPRHEATALRRFLSICEPTGDVSKGDADVTRTVLQKYEDRIKRDLSALDETFLFLINAPYVNVFSLDDDMLNRATSLTLAGIAAKPFDHAILAGVLVASSRLWVAGERGSLFAKQTPIFSPGTRMGMKSRCLRRPTTKLTSGFMETLHWRSLQENLIRDFDNAFYALAGAA